MPHLHTTPRTLSTAFPVALFPSLSLSFSSYVGGVGLGTLCFIISHIAQASTASPSTSSTTTDSGASSVPSSISTSIASVSSSVSSSVAALSSSIAASVSSPRPVTTYKPVWEIGMAGVHIQQQAYPGSAHHVQQTLVVPTAIYRSKRLNVDDKGLNFKTFNSLRYETDWAFAGSLGYRANTGARQGMDNLGFLLETGPRLTMYLGQTGNINWRAELPLRAVFDVSDKFNYRGVNIEPELVAAWQHQKWKWQGSLSAIIADEKKNSLLYEVTAADATETRPVYTANAGFSHLRATTSLSYRFSPHMRVFAFARVDDTSHSVNRDSPLIEKDRGTSYGTGFSYTWKTSPEKIAITRIEPY